METKQMTEMMTADDSLATFLRFVKNSVWPNGVLIEPAPEIEESERQRARDAAFAALPKIINHIPGL